MKKISLCFIVIVLVALMLSVSCTTPQKQTWTIGAILPLTGNLAFLGGPEKDALQVAVSEINSAEGREAVRLIVEDSKGQAKEAVTAARKLIDIDKVDLSIVSTSAIANAVAPAFQQSNLPFVTMCSDGTISQKYNKGVNIYVNLASEQKAMSNYLVSQGVSSLSVIRVNAQVTEQGIKLLKDNAGGKLQIVNELTYDLGTTDFKNLVTKVKDDTSQALYFMGYGVEFPSLIKTVRELGIQKKLFGNYTFLSDGARKEGVELYKDINFTAFSITPEDVVATSFGKEFSKLRGGNPGPFMDYIFAYEAVKTWYQLVKSGIQPSAFPERIRGQRFKTLFGEMEVDTTGNAVSPMVVATYADNGSVKVTWK